MQGALILGPHPANDGIQDEVNLPLEPKEGIRAALSVRHRQKRVAVWWLPLDVKQGWFRASQDVVAKFRNWASKFPARLG
jgi:hypothetical protein